MRIEIYKITNLLNDKCYIGQTKNGVFKRFQQHCKTDSLIGRAIKKYGHDNFIIETIDSTDNEDMANELEYKYIIANDCVVPNGYNANEYGRLLGNMIDEWYVALKPKYYNKIVHNEVCVLYFYKAIKLSNKDFVLKINHRRYVETWGELWDEIGCSKKDTRKRVRDFIKNNDFIIKKDKRMILNKEKFKIIY